MALQIGDRFCALSENQLADVNSGCRWPMPEIGIFQAMDLSASGITSADCQRALSQICELWNACGHLSLHVAPAANQANIFTQSGRIDGPMGVLGQSYLPCGNVGPTTQLAQLLDNGENWTFDMLLRVWLHEVGHALGLEHAARGSGNVMEPYLTRFTKPQAGDIAAIDIRYPGGPIMLPTPAPGPDDPVEAMFDFTRPGNWLGRFELEGDSDTVGKGVIINIPSAGKRRVKVSFTPR